ncbi:MAG: cobalamin-dependent protein, partial [Anaerolineales bacterium]|nr:cobalamin-dependent protein [Anaerolineales bacterium]
MSSLDSLVQAVMDGMEEEAIAAVEKVVQEGVPVETIIEELTGGMREIGNQFALMEIFLPEMMTAAQAMQKVLQVLEPQMKKSATASETKGVVVIGTVEGDMHEIGKDIVISLLQVNGFEVHDLGFNVNSLEFVNQAIKLNADIIGVSALMTTTMPAQREIVEFLKEKGVRDKFHVILGGAPV